VNESRLLDALLAAVRGAARYNRGVQAAPAAILWTDAERQWAPAVPALRALGLPIYEYGEYQPERHRGPAIWLKCVLAGTVPGIGNGAETPVVYLGGVSRNDLRAIEHCPRDLQPLAELQYRGAFFTQTNGKDWTANAFLTSSHGGLGLEVAQDQGTQKSLLRTLASGELLEVKLSTLRARLVDAAWLDSLITPNSTRDILSWLNQPAVMAQAWVGARWDVFADRCRKDFGFDPVQDGELVAAEKLAEHEGPWAGVWELYADSWSSFPNVIGLLEQLTPPPPADLLDDRSGYPAHDLAQEDVLRVSLVAIGTKPPAEARTALVKADEAHSGRRDLLWRRMGRAPLAVAVGHLRAVAERSVALPAGESPDALAADYRERYWQVDAAACDALAATRTKADLDAVVTALRPTYVHWLAETADRLQQTVCKVGWLNANKPMPTPAADGTCLVFVDGLRYDVAMRLAPRLHSLGKASVAAAWTSLPSVTASGKAWASPVADKITGTTADLDFQPSVADTGKPLNTATLRKLLEANGWQVLAGQETGDPAGRAWTECGDLDHYGHEHGLRLARELDNQLTEIVERLAGLAEAGWQRLRVVTDHGWLLVPGGLPKAQLDKFEVETRWGRCAVLKEQAQGAHLTFGWDWCPDVQVAMAPGISSFIAGAEYAHGGLSLQECLVPLIDIECKKAKSAGPKVTIKGVTWRGLRCNLTVEPAIAGLTADIRTKAAAAESSVAAAPKLIEDGKASLVVPNDSLEGSAAVVVILDAQGKVIQKAATTIGE
jgi:hypothetical protein